LNIETIFHENDIYITRLELGAWATNCYVVLDANTGDSALIDVPPGARTLVKNLRGTDLKYTLLTHNHIDHIAGLKALRQRLFAPLVVYPSDNTNWLPFPPEILLQDGQIIKSGGIRIEAIHTPGHTPGSTSFLIGDCLICGDTLFPGGPGRTFSAPAFRRIVKSITLKLFKLPDDTRVFPGHGVATTIGEAKKEFAVFASCEHDPGLHGDIVWLKT
jgi:hydroxyacylglutathione hydrolase